MIDFEELFMLLSGYFDEDLENDLIDEINELIDEDLWCQAFFNTFNRTLELCHELEEEEEEEMEVPKDVHMQLFESIRIEIYTREGP